MNDQPKQPQDTNMNIHDRWIKHQQSATKTTSAFACAFCLERTIFSTSSALRSHAREKHRDRLPAEEEETEGVWSQFETESALKRWATLSRLQASLPTPRAAAQPCH